MISLDEEGGESVDNAFCGALGWTDWLSQNPEPESKRGMRVLDS